MSRDRNLVNSPWPKADNNRFIWSEAGLPGLQQLGGHLECDQGPGADTQPRCKADTFVTLVSGKHVRACMHAVQQLCRPLQDTVQYKEKHC